MKHILAIKDPECEIGFGPLTEFCQVVQERIGPDVLVIPFWPSADVELIGDKRKIKLTIAEYKGLVEALEKEIDEN